MNPASYLETADLRRLQQVGFLALIGAAVAGLFLISDVESLIGYFAILATSSLPIAIWLQRGAKGLPILPIVSLGYFSYYGAAILTANTDNYVPDEILRAALTVALFLAAAWLSWSGCAFRHQPEKFELDRQLNLDFALSRLIFGALLLDLVFDIGVKTGWWTLFGTWFGVLRSLAMSAASVGCFLLGFALGRRILTESEKYAAFALFAGLIAIEISTLIMHTAIILVAATLFGYVISSKRIPWSTIAIVVCVATILHMSEGAERDQYWSAEGDRETISIAEMPGLLAGWFSTGVQQAVNGGDPNQQSFAARASQLTTLLLTQEQTPQNISYLYGETYANFPRMLIPRFLSPDKITSQANLNLLSIHYGLQNREDVRATTIAWNLVPEAYANFGYFGVIFAGVAFGLLTGGLTWIASGAPAVSLRGLIGLSALVTMIELEYDFSYLLLNLLQAMFSISVFFLGMKFLEHETDRSHRAAFHIVP